MALSETDLAKSYGDYALKFWWMLPGGLWGVHTKLCHIVKSKMILYDGEELCQFKHVKHNGLLIKFLRMTCPVVIIEETIQVLQPEC